MADHDRVFRDDLAPADVARLDQNWSAANNYLDYLLELNRQHRDTHCTDGATRVCSVGITRLPRR